MSLAHHDPIRTPDHPPDLPDLPDQAEQALVTRVVDALYREDHQGLRTRGRPAAAPDLPRAGAVRATWWTSPPLGEHRVVLPMCADGFLADQRLAAPFLVVEPVGGPPTLAAHLDEVLAALAPEPEPPTGADDQPDELVAGWNAFADECRQALAGARLPVPTLVPPPAGAGYRGLARYEAIAARGEHPVHPLGRCRIGLSPPELLRYAPEFAPRFRLRWCAVPADPLTRSGSLPAWWPSPTSLGLSPGPDGDRVALPVHPLTAARGLVAVGPRARVVVTPTLSTRTVAVLADPTVTLKLPLPTATLGARNRRTIAPGTLADGATMHRLLGTILDREPAVRGRVLLADESTWLHTGDENRAVLIRRLPPDLDGATLVPVAALTAPGSPAGPILSDLAARYPGGLPALLVDYLDALFDWHVLLWLRYGVALEAHGQNITLVIDPPPGPRPAVRLLYKDNDGGRIDRRRLGAALSADSFHDPRINFSDPRITFSDPRITGADDRDLADMVTTITLHLCAAVPLRGLTDDPAARRTLMGLIRDRFAAAADRWSDRSDPAARRSEHHLRSGVLNADRLPVKAMVTAGTLVPKHRLGCSDINTCYLRSGPNYLRAGG